MVDKSTPRVNNQIRAKEVRLISHEGKQLGIVTIKQASAVASQAGLDLVEVDSSSTPPIVKIMNYGKYKYELAKKQKANKASSPSRQLKEVRFKAKIETHDYETKVKQIEKFLGVGHTVKVFVQLKGRERSHPEVAVRLAERLIQDLSGKFVFDGKPSNDNGGAVMKLAPKLK